MTDDMTADDWRQIRIDALNPAVKLTCAILAEGRASRDWNGEDAVILVKEIADRFVEYIVRNDGRPSE